MSILKFSRSCRLLGILLSFIFLSSLLAISLSTNSPNVSLSAAIAMVVLSNFAPLGYFFFAMSSTALIIFFQWFVLYISGLDINDVLTFGNLTWVLAACLGSIFLWFIRLKVASGLNATETYDKETSVQEFRELANNVPILIWTADPDGKINYISEKISMFCGMSVDSILANWLDVLHPSDQDGAIRSWQHSVTTGETFSTEYRIRRFDNVFVWHSVQASPVYDQEGHIKQWYGSSCDVDTVKQLQNESQKLITKLNDTIESVTDSFITIDNAFKITYINQRAADIAGESVDDLLGSEIWLFCGIGKKSLFMRKFKAAMSEQKKLQFEELLSSRQVWLDVHVYPSSLGLTIYFNDITIKRANQEELLLLRTAISRVNDIILITEAEPLHMSGPRVVFANEAFEKVTGYSKSDIIGKTPRILQGELTEGEELEKIRTALKNYQPVRTQLVNYKKNGQKYWVEIDLVPLESELGVVTHYVAVERDISEQKIMQEQLYQSQKMESIGQLTGGIAHDFNNLLTVMLGNAELLLESLPLDSALLPLADTIYEASRRGGTLTQSLLTFSSSQTLSNSQFNVNDAISSFRTILEAALGQKHILNFALKDNLPDISIDKVHFENALLNMVINARDAMDTSGEVTVKTYKEENQSDGPKTATQTTVVIEIQDTGKGIETELQEKIFEPFYSTKQPGQGTGLGLSMVFGFIRQTGGGITVSSTLGKGTSFYLRFPAVLTKRKTKVHDKKQISHTKHEYKVLLVEDDAMVREYAFNVLHKAGFDVSAAANGSQAISLLQSDRQFDLMFTDVVMAGGINGFELAEYAKVHTPNTRLLITSGYNEQSKKRKGQLSNNEAILKKPYSKSELLERIHQLMYE